MSKTFFIFVSVIITLLFTNCEKKPVNAEDITGEWVAEEKADTIYFMDESNFFHSTKNMRYDHYNYSISGDTMQIGYNGKMMILVVATKHYFDLKDEDLTIDLSNRQCFGFPRERMVYKRVQRIIIE